MGPPAGPLRAPFAAGLSLGLRVLLRQPALAGGVLLAGLLMGLSRGLALGRPTDSAALHAETCMASVLLLVWLVSPDFCAAVRSEAGSLFGALEGGATPTHPRWPLGGAAWALVATLLPVTTVVVGLGLCLVPGQWGAIAGTILPVILLTWLGAASVGLWSMLLWNWVSRPAVIVITLLVVLLDLAPPTGGGGRLWTALIFPVSPGVAAADEGLAFASVARWTLAGALHVVGLWLALLATTPLGEKHRR